MLLWLMIFCALYPIYTLGLRSRVIGLIGNEATAIFALVAAYRVQRQSHVAAALLMAVVGWVSFASYLTVEELRRGGL